MMRLAVLLLVLAGCSNREPYAYCFGNNIEPVCRSTLALCDDFRAEFAASRGWDLSSTTDCYPVYK